MTAEAGPAPDESLLEYLKAQYVNFSDNLASECNRRNFSYSPEVANEKLTAVEKRLVLTAVEKRLVTKQSFGDDLKFTVDVN